MRKFSNPLIQLAISAALVGGVVEQQISLEPVAAAGGPISTVDITGPAGTGIFGYRVLVLSNGNFVVSDPSYDSASQPDVGAVYLYNGTTGKLISTLQGSSAQDFVGSSLTEVGDSNVLVSSQTWHNGSIANAGAVTWIDGTTGLDGVVSSSNSFVGGTANDFIGGLPPEKLTNGNVVLTSPSWQNAPASYAGAATWIDGNAGGSGVVGPTNSIVGATNLDFFHSDVVALTNGNYVVATPSWTGPGVAAAGAATWGNGTTGTAGVISSTISLVGTTLNDGVGQVLVALANGNYVVGAPAWDNGPTFDVGAAVWANGAAGLAGPVTAANSLHGATIMDHTGEITALPDGNYVVASPNWSNGVRVGAVTWANGLAGSTGNVTVNNSVYGTSAGDFSGVAVSGLPNGNFVVDATSWDNGNIAEAGLVSLVAPATTGQLTVANSLYGTSANDNVGSRGVYVLSNGNFVVQSPNWTNGVPMGGFGAVTWGSAVAGVSGPVSASNSWVGATAGDRVGLGQLVELTNGNFVFGVTGWDDNATINAGAAVWGSGTTGGIGPVSALNALVGSSEEDGVGNGIFALPDGDYVVDSPNWSNGATANVGAITRGNGQTGTFGVVSTANSLTGTTPMDVIGDSGVVVLDDGSFVVKSTRWDGGGAPDVGAVTRLAPEAPTVGSITAANSLVGTTADDRVGTDVVAVAGGGYVVRSSVWDRVGIANAGAATLGEPGTGVIGPITPQNSVLGGLVKQGGTITADGHKTSGGAVVVTRREEDIVTLVKPYVAPPNDPNDPNDPNNPTPADKTDYVPLAPSRLVDTRVGYSTVDGLQAGGGQREVGSTLEVSVAGRGGVAANATGVALNVTAVDSVADGFVTVFPCGEERPTASNVNVATGATVPNAVLSKIGVDGKVCVFTSQPMDLVVDSAGYFPPTSSYNPANPARVLDSRAAGLTADGQQQGVGLREAGSVTEVQITGRAGVPADATTAALNVTATEAEGPGYVTVYPCGEPRPLASSLNYTAGGTVANLVVSKIGADGRVCLYTQLGTHLVVDVGGYFPTTTSYKSLNPARMLETRDGLSTFDAQFNGLGAIPAATVTEVKVTGRGGVPASAATVVLNVTVTEPAAAGYVTIYPCGIEPPLASNLNYVGGQTVANATVVKVGANGNVCVYNSQKTHLVIDASGYFPPVS